jgi:hypothetical protein
MNRKDVIRMAQKAGMEWDDACGVPLWLAYESDLERFATLVAAHEREACAKVCEPQSAHDDPLTAWKIAAAIRARGEVPR